LDETTGLPTSKFRLKRPTDPYFTRGRTQEQTESAKDLIEYIAMTLNSFQRHPKTDETLDLAAADGSLYDMPLMKAHFGQFVRDNYTKSGAKGVLTGIWHGFKSRIRPLTEELFEGGRDNQRRWERNANRRAEQGAYNPYIDISSTERERLLAAERLS